VGHVRRSEGDETFDLEALYGSSRDDVYAYVAALVGDRASAEEVTSAAFERVLTRRSTYSPDRGSARAWLFGIARNAAYDELRRRRRTMPVEEVHGQVAVSADTTAETATRRAALAVALLRLDRDDRELVALRFEAGLSHAEIGSVLGISESNAGTRLSRVLGRLRTAME
jgi:RNA polymerase sigma factor (sigma-70 family)